MTDVTAAVRQKVRSADAPPPGILLVIALAGLACVGVSLVLARSATGITPLHAALVGWITVSYVMSGLVAWWRLPESRFGPLMVVTGFSAFVTTLSWSTNTVLHTIGVAFDLVPLVLIVHVFLAFPSGRLGGTVERALVATGYVAAVGGQLVVMMLGGLGTNHVLGFVEAPDVAVVIHNVELIVISGVALVAVGLLGARRRAGGRPLRRSLALLVDSFALGLVTIAVLLIMGVFAGASFPTVQRVSLAVLGLAPLAFLIGLLNARLARSAAGGLLVELRAEPVDLRAPLARALRDPSLELVYWLPEFGSWADQSGQPVELPTSNGARTTTMVERNGERVAALVHDSELSDEPELLDAVSAAAGMALENGRLRAKQRAHVDELRASRVRVIEAGQRERRRLERDLHDGAQQRLVALALDLGLLEASHRDDAEVSASLDRARRQIAMSLDELRDVARGLYPAVLTGHGLEIALESLTATATVPVRLAVRLDGRLAEAVEVAAYYVVCESLANIGKHAHASSAIVSVANGGGQLVVEVIDDGVGGADTERGTGLRGLADRVEALSGRLRVWTPLGGGTRVRAEIPCG